VRHAWLFVAVLTAAGCASGKSDEAEAYRELQPKPMTEAQKQALEKVKGSVPAPPGLHGKP
jgi:hypothetical protein